MMNYLKNVKLQIILVLSLMTLLFPNCDPKNTSPECEITGPVDGDIYLPGEEIQISISATDKEGDLASVDLYINDQLVYTFTSAPYNVNWDTWGEDLANYTIEAVATDKDGKEGSSSVNISLQQGIVYNNMIYSLNLGYLDYYGAYTASTYNFDVFLMSSSFLTTNTGNGLYLEMFSSSSTDLLDGTYLYDHLETYAAFTFDYSDFIIDYNLDTDVGISGDVTGGYAKIEENGGTYRIFVDCTTSTGIPILAYYEGPFIYTDNTSKKSSETKRGIKNYRIK